MAEEDRVKHVGNWKGRRVFKLEDGSEHLIEMSEDLVELFKQQNQED